MRHLKECIIFLEVSHGTEAHDDCSAVARQTASAVPRLIHFLSRVIECARSLSDIHHLAFQRPTSLVSSTYHLAYHFGMSRTAGMLYYVAVRGAGPRSDHELPVAMCPFHAVSDP